MRDSRPITSPPLIERASPRALFASLLADALGAAPEAPSPMATAYLVELLEARLRESGGEGVEPEETLAEAWCAAAAATGRARLQGLQELGDRALFVSGYFAASLTRRVAGGGYYRDMGRIAYGALASALAPTRQERSWPLLFEELADRFPELTQLLAEVSDRACRDRPEWLLALYDRYLATGSADDRARLVRAGCVLPARAGRPQ